MASDVWITWVLLPLGVVLLMTIDVLGRYVRLRDRPEAWTTRNRLSGAAVWTVALLILAGLRSREFTRSAVVAAPIFGFLYYGMVTWVRRSITRSSR